jgi:putative aldouronate transport system substrate-binding protein
MHENENRGRTGQSLSRGNLGALIPPTTMKPTLSASGDGAGVTRRRFIRFVGAGTLAVTALPLLSACGQTVPAVSATAVSAVATAAPAAIATAQPAAATVASVAATVAPVAATALVSTTVAPGTSATVAPATIAAAPTVTAKAGGALPTYAPTTTGPKPDISSSGPLYEDGFSTYPTNPLKALPSTPPGTGSRVDIFTTAFLPLPPNPVDQNPAWQEVNKQLNANVNFSSVSQADFQAKFAALMAGNDLPDIALVRDMTPNLSAALQTQAADLTPYLGGDAAKDYPNLAAIPTFAWKNCGAVQNGHLYMIPIERYAPGYTLYRNSEIYDAEIGPNYTPKNADDFKRVLQQLNRPAEGRWAIGAWQNTAFQLTFFLSTFGVPNNWAQDSSGKLTKDFETPQYQQAVAYLRDLVAAGVFHPDSPTLVDVNAGRTYFLGGKWVLNLEIFGVAWQDLLQRGPKLQPSVTALPIAPFAAVDGQKAVHYLRPGYIAMNMLKKAPPERLKELLRIINWLAAPFGSAEDLLLTVGVKDVDYTVDANGNVIPTDKSNADANLVNWKYHVQHPQVAYATGVPAYAKLATDFEKIAVPLGVPDPSWGLWSPTNEKRGVPLNQTFMDGVTDIVAGRRPVTDLAGLVGDWRNGGGEQIRTEFQQAIAAAT